MATGGRPRRGASQPTEWPRGQPHGHGECGAVEHCEKKKVKGRRSEAKNATTFLGKGSHGTPAEATMSMVDHGRNIDKMGKITGDVAGLGVGGEVGAKLPASLGF